MRLGLTEGAIKCKSRCWPDPIEDPNCQYQRYYQEANGHFFEHCFYKKKEQNALVLAGLTRLMDLIQVENHIKDHRVALGQIIRIG